MIDEKIIPSNLQNDAINISEEEEEKNKEEEYLSDLLN